MYLTAGRRAPRLWSMERSALARCLRRIGAATLAAGMASAATAAEPEIFPSRHVTIVVPFAAGGPADAIARVMAERMRSSLRKSVVVENVSGAAGTIGVGRVARAAPDGYTINMGPGWATHVLNAA